MGFMPVNLFQILLFVSALHSHYATMLLVGLQ